MKNMKIEINAEQPLDEIVRELKRLGYKHDRNRSYKATVILTKDNGLFSKYASPCNAFNDNLTTLAELKGMKC